MSDLRVCEVVKTLDVGGAEVLLVERLIRARTDVLHYTVVCMRASTGELVERLRAAGVTVVDLSACPRPLVYARLAATVRRLAPHVLNVHSPAPAVVLRPLVRFTGWLSGRPALVRTVHNEHWRRFGRLDRLTRGLDDCTVAVSPLVARSKATAGCRRVLTRVHGVDVAEQRRWSARAAEVRREFGVPGDAFLFACVANFRPQKNHRLLVEAATEVVRRRPGTLFLLAGDGPLRHEITREVAALGLDGSIQVLGQVPRAGRLVAAADVLVLSSDHEGLPVVVMEALAAGVPVVSTRVGGVPDLVVSGHNGILTEPGSAPGLTGAMLQAMEPRTHRDLRAGALASAEGLDMAGTAEWFEQLYEELAR
ncbi:glycosyltransferase [Microbispora cellulosiformans]|uniref:Glycosyltransferase n=1 Tax=Microbispora cellulosiformans TaxID=2614688 RepID=A0A5J5JZX3_9ACTN|nr:glycosyltransferase [Microbispora cellulosiformans]KAA9377516.1 glycosyltransferase [Microbispora cellulosiformans]